MPRRAKRFRRIYGSHPMHLMTMGAGFALAGYVVVTAGPATLWKPQGAWWHSIALWFAAAVIAHDLFLFPMYAAADRLLGIARRPTSRDKPPVPPRNHLRLPALGSGLIFLLFFPGIIRQGAHLYLADTGLTQRPFLGRWLLLTTAMFATSAVLYATRLLLAQRRGPAVERSSSGTRPHTDLEEAGTGA